MAASKKVPIPKGFRSIDEAAAFWDSHSLADYAEYLTPTRARFQLRRRVHLLAVDPDIAAQLRVASRARGLSPETVANLWLRERLAAEPKRRSSRRAA
jgi:hypothetical protein